MSDKEFDKQFRNKFESFEVKPSAFAWDEINKELSGAKKRTFPFYEVTAACLVAMLGASIWFAPQKEHIKLYGKAQQDTVPVTVLNQSILEESSSVAEKEIVIAEVEQSPSQIKYPRLTKELGESISQHEPVVETSRESRVDSSRAANEIASNPPVALREEIASIEPVRVKRLRNEVLALQPQTVADTSEEKSKHKIKSVGDLVNFVVSKVDRRKNKIIEFSNQDEGNIVSGINLGLIQYKVRDN